MKYITTVLILLIAVILVGSFIIVFNQIPNKPEDHILGGVRDDIKQLIHDIPEGRLVKIYPKPTPLTVTIKNKDVATFVTTDNRQFKYSDLQYIIKGQGHGYDWQTGQPYYRSPDKIINVGDTIVFDLRQPEPPYVSITHKGDVDFATDNGATVLYDHVGLIAEKVPPHSFLERLVLAFAQLPLFLLWAFVDFMTVMIGNGR